MPQKPIEYSCEGCQKAFKPAELTSYQTDKTPHRFCNKCWEIFMDAKYNSLGLIRMKNLFKVLSSK